MTFFRTLLQRTMSKFDKHPYAGNCLLGTTIGMAGDGLAQVCFPEAPSTDKASATTDVANFDWKRTLSIGAYSAVVYPLLTRWYLWQEALCGATQGLGVVLAQKVAMDEFLLAPFFNGGYLSYAALVGGDSVSDSLRENFWDVMFADWMVWPSVMVVCFLKVPVQFRPAYGASLFYLLLLLFFLSLFFFCFCFFLLFFNRCNHAKSLTLFCMILFCHQPPTPTVAFVGVGWNTFLAYKAHSELTEVLLDSDTVLGGQVFPNEAAPLVEPLIGVLKESRTLPLNMIRRTTTARHRSGNTDSTST